MDGFRATPGQHAELPAGGQVALYVDGGLGMEGENAGSGIGELAEVALGMLDHEVNVERAGS